MPTPEELVRIIIDSRLTAYGWMIQNMIRLNHFASRRAVIRELLDEKS